MNAVVTGILSSSVAQRVGWALVHFVWQGAAVALLLALVLALLRRRSAQARWVASCAALGLMMALAVATVCMVSVKARQALPSALVAPEAATPVAVAPELPAVPALATPLIVSARAAPVGTADVAGALPWRQQAERLVRPALPWAFLGWLVGVIGMSLWHLGGWLQLRRIRAQGSEPGGAAIRDAFGRLLARLRISRPVRLLESARVAVPTVVGWLRPVVLLPVSAMTGLTPQQLEAVLAHELAHIRRYDCLVRLVQALVETLLFYHPAVWWVSGRIRQESEHCCDELAVEVCGDRQSYARALARVAELGRRKPHLAAAASGGKLLGRIQRIVGLPDRDPVVSARWLAGLLVVAALLMAGLIMHACAAAKTQQPALTEQPAKESESAWGEAVEGGQVSKNTGAAAALAAELTRTPRNSPEALRDFGVEKSEPIESGFFFYAGKYVEMPYVVERQGLDIFINGHCVQPGPEYPPFEYDVSKDPGDPPPGSSPFDPPPEGVDRRDTYWARKSAYLTAHYGDSAYVEKMIETYLKSTEVATVEPLPGFSSLYVVTLKDGRTQNIGFMGGAQSVPQDKESFLRGASRTMAYVEKSLRAGSVSFIAGGAEVGIGSRTGLRVVEALLSSEDPAVRLENVVKLGIAPGKSDKAFWGVMASEFEPSEQLAERFKRWNEEIEGEKRQRIIELTKDVGDELSEKVAAPDFMLHAVVPLVKAANRTDGPFMEVFRQLARTGREAMPQLKQALEDPAVGLTSRGAAALLLVHYGDTSGWPVLEQIVERGSGPEMNVTASRMGELKDRTFLPLIEKALKRDDAQQTVTYAAAYCGDEDAIPILKEALNHPNSGVRWGAEKWLGEFRGRETKNPEVEGEVRSAIETLEGTSGESRPSEAAGEPAEKSEAEEPPSGEAGEQWGKRVSTAEDLPRIEPGRKKRIDYVARMSLEEVADNLGDRNVLGGGMRLGAYPAMGPIYFWADALPCNIMVLRLIEEGREDPDRVCAILEKTLAKKIDQLSELREKADQGYATDPDPLAAHFSIAAAFYVLANIDRLDNPALLERWFAMPEIDGYGKPYDLQSWFIDCYFRSTGVASSPYAAIHRAIVKNRPAPNQRHTRAKWNQPWEVDNPWSQLPSANVREPKRIEVLTISPFTFDENVRIRKNWEDYLKQLEKGG